MQKSDEGLHASFWPVDVLLVNIQRGSCILLSVDYNMALTKCTCNMKFL